MYVEKHKTLSEKKKAWLDWEISACNVGQLNEIMFFFLILTCIIIITNIHYFYINMGYVHIKILGAPQDLLQHPSVHLQDDLLEPDWIEQVIPLGIDVFQKISELTTIPIFFYLFKTHNSNTAFLYKIEELKYNFI